VSNRIERELESLNQAFQQPDPFGPTANPAAYVPCEAMEAALFELVQTVRSERRAAAISGPPGLGKTLLLHLLADCLSPRIRFVYIPYAALPPDELCTWVLDLLGTQASDDPVSMLKAYGEHLRGQGSALLLLVDDAGAIPVDTARMLGNLVSTSDGGLRLAVASTDSPEASRALAALGSDINMIRLVEPMSAAETRRYLEARLAMAQVPDAIRAHFGEETVATLHRVSGGIPRRLNALAADVMRGIPSQVAAARLDALPPSDDTPAPEASPPPEPELDLAEVAPDAAEAPPAEAVEPREAETPPTPGPPAHVLRPTPRTALIVAAAAAVVGVVLGISLMRSWVSAPPPDGEPARVAATAEPERAEEEPPKPLAVAAPGVEEALAQVSPEPAATREGERFSLEELLPAPAPASPDQAPEAEPVEVGESEALAVLLESLAVTEEAATEASQPEAPEAAEAEVAALVPEPPAVTEEAATEVSQPEAPEVAATPEPPAVTEEATTEVLQPETPEVAAAEALAAIPKAPEPPEAPAASFPVQVNATPWATIEIDGEDFGETPLAGIPLPGGSHSFRARMPDGRIIERVVEIDADNRFVVFE
jgi:type II secretory pathway predicted ATPase ExeA